MKQLIFIQSCFILFVACQAIDPTVICHGGAGSVAESRVSKKHIIIIIIFNQKNNFIVCRKIQRISLSRATWI